MSPPVVKAMKLGRIAKENGWHGSIESEVVGTERITLLEATRNDELMRVNYVDNTMVGADYSIFDYQLKLHTACLVEDKLRDWPDLLKLFKLFPHMNRPTLVERYRRLPFSPEDSNDEIMSKLVGHKLFWYSHEHAALRCDVVLPPRGAKASSYRIQDVGHRKMFHFIGVQAGFRSVLLDTLIKVG
jgi:hypothetical protein